MRPRHWQRRLKPQEMLLHISTRRFVHNGTIIQPRSAFEQYQALVAADRAWTSLESDARERVLRAIDAATAVGGSIAEHGDRYERARAIRIRARSGYR